MSYLEDAAAELCKARHDNEGRARDAGEMHSGMAVTAAAISAEVNTRRVELAAGFARLAAIEAGLAPCLGHSSTEEDR
jgi:hypothetical protein